jgi:hypothetical protein
MKVLKSFYLLVVLGVILFSLSSYACDLGLDPNAGQKGVIRRSRTSVLHRFFNFNTLFHPE